jgi:hypothetical protein
MVPNRGLLHLRRNLHRLCRCLPVGTGRGRAARLHPPQPRLRRNLASAAFARRPGGRRKRDELPFKVVRSNSHDELLAQAVSLFIARGAYRAAVPMYPDDLIELRQGAHVIEKSK